jgi:hypothetical protein
LAGIALMVSYVPIFHSPAFAFQQSCMYASL